jgi:hypothetical protein
MGISSCERSRARRAVDLQQGVGWALASLLIMLGCTSPKPIEGVWRRPEPLSAPVVNDKSVTFPLTPARDSTKVGLPGRTYELDGDVLLRNRRPERGHAWMNC